ncbi:MAG: alpha/beta fold hydrolase [Shimia sp.]|uniref:alpha/beta fold hydrolase n=1 Tax=Shimia sp. TaxID=1954381 RepID=UPI0040599290
MNHLPRHVFVPLLDHEIHVTEWGDPEAPPVLLWHGLARTGRDFDELAAGLADSHFVLCPDTIGRGLSSWSHNPEVEYSIGHYADIAVGLLDHYQIDQSGWLGTSMGGQIGMRLASGALADRLAYLIINDIGPEVPQDAINRILAYASDLPVFVTLTEAELWLRTAYAPFGRTSDRYWSRMARTSVRRQESGKFTLHYDPRIVVQFGAFLHEQTVWDSYANITLPCHVFRGRSSDILTEKVLEKMSATGPKPKSTVIEDCGHAPSLSGEHDIYAIRQLISSMM